MKKLLFILLLIATLFPVDVSAQVETQPMSRNAATNLYSTWPLGFVSRARFAFGTTTALGQFTISASSSPETTPILFVASSTGQSLLTVLGGGEVGVGTSSPGTIFSVQGVSNFTTATTTWYSSGGINFTGLTGCPVAISGTCLSTGGGSGTVNSSTAGYNAYYAANGSTISGTSTLYMSSNERVGVGTISPTAKFHTIDTGGVNTVVGVFEKSATTNVNAVLQIASVNSFAETTRVAGLKTNSSGDFMIQTGSTAIGTEGAPRLTAAVGGNVGVGSSTPWGLLSVNPNAIGTAPSFVVGSSTRTHFIVANDGNVGVGTTSPYAKFSVAGQAVAGYFTATSTATASTLPYASSTALTVSGSFYNGSLTSGRVPYVTTSGLLIDSSGLLYNGTRLTANYASTTSFTSSGNSYLSTSGQVAIGNTSPTANTATHINNSSIVNQLVIGPGTAETTHSVDVYTPTGASQNIISVVRTNNTQGVGLQFQPQGANTSSNVNWIMGMNSSSNNFAFSTWNGSSVTEYFTITNNTGGGNVGIGTTTPWKKFSVNGNVAMAGLTSSGTGNAVCISTSNEILNGGGGTCTPSSIKFKENVTPLLADKSLDTLMKLRPVEFDYKDKQAHETNHSYGLIAEEVEKVDKNLVDYKKDGTIFGLHIEKIVGLLVSNMQNVIARVSGLEKKVDEQDKRIAELEKIINEMK